MWEVHVLENLKCFASILSLSAAGNATGIICEIFPIPFQTQFVENFNEAND